MRHHTRTCLYSATVLVLLYSRSATAQSFVPKQAQAVGYDTLTFSSTFVNSSVDVSGRNTAGFSWYLWNFFGEGATADELRFNADHSLTLLGGSVPLNAQIATVAPAKAAGGYVGVAFGGGAYIEATLKFNPADGTRANYVGHPSFWSLALEHLIALGKPDSVPRARWFEHFIEADFFEYDLLQHLQVPNVYGGAMHVWYGIWNTTCSTGLCNIVTPYRALQRWVPSNTDFTQYHAYGFLWIPATSKSVGYAQYYFDNEAVGSRITWQHDTSTVNAVSDAKAAFSIIDRQHLVLILGTRVGEPMTVQSVRVFQKSRSANLVH